MKVADREPELTREPNVDNIKLSVELVQTGCLWPHCKKGLATPPPHSLYSSPTTIAPPPASQESKEKNNVKLGSLLVIDPPMDAKTLKKCVQGLTNILRMNFIAMLTLISTDRKKSGVV